MKKKKLVFLTTCTQKLDNIYRKEIVGLHSYIVIHVHDKENHKNISNLYSTLTVLVPNVAEN